jgi:hypothetical protein
LYLSPPGGDPVARPEVDALRFTVVIPLHQKAPWVERCLDSVAAQTCRDFEVVVVDDGSTDGGGALVANRRDLRIRVVRQDNLGEGAARNRGLAEATSEWVALLDADDEWLPSFLEEAAAAAERDPELVAIFTNVVEADTGRPLLQRPVAGRVGDYFALALRNRGFGMTASSTVARREALLRAGGFRVGVESGADLDAWARLAWSGPVGCVPTPLAIYHQGLPGSATMRARRARPEFPAVARSHREWQAAGRIPAGLRETSARFVDRLVLDHAAALVNCGASTDARRVLLGPDVPRWSLRRALLLLRSLLPRSLQASLRRRLGRLGRHELPA